MTEILLHCFATEGYILSFLFWVHIVSTIAIVFDVESVWHSLIGYQFSVQDDLSKLEDTVDTLQINRNLGMFARSAKLTRIVRLIRLLGILRLYKNVKQQQQEQVNRQILQDALKKSTNQADMHKSIKLKMEELKSQN